MFGRQNTGGDGFKNPKEVGRRNGGYGEMGGGRFGATFGDPFAQVAGMLAVECFPEAFLKPGFLGIGGEHFAPGDSLQNPLGQTRVPRKNSNQQESANPFQRFELTAMVMRVKGWGVAI